MNEILCLIKLQKPKFDLGCFKYLSNAVKETRANLRARTRVRQGRYL